MASEFVAVSIHHALGGRPLWLVLNGQRNGPEAQANAAVAGHRLNRVLGGANGHFAIDAAWSGYFTRCNEAVVVATYMSSFDPTEAIRAAEAAKTAIVDVCGGKLLDVTLPTLNKLGIEVQLAVRKAILGFGRLQHAPGQKVLELHAITVSPDLAPDDPAQAAIRAANDVTNPTRSTALAEAFQQSSAKGDALAEGVRGLRVPAAAVENPAAVSALRIMDEAVTASIRCARSSRPLLKLLPRISQSSVSPPPSPVRAAKKAGPHPGEDEDSGDEGQAGGAKAGHDASKQITTASMDDFMWTPSAEAAAAASGTDIVEFDVDFPDPASSAAAVPALPKETLVVRIAAQVSETVTLSAKMNGPETVTVEGSAVCKYMYGSAQGPAVQDSGHGPVPFNLLLRTAGPLASINLTTPGQTAQQIQLKEGGPAGADGSVAYVVPVALPPRQPNVVGNPAGDLCSLTYRYAPSFNPQLFKASASCRMTFTATEDGQGQVHRYTDVIVRSMLGPGVTAATAQVQLLVPLPAPPAAAGAAQAPAYQPPMAKPSAQWSVQAGKGQILWALLESDGNEEGAGPDVPYIRSFFGPGRQAEFKARVPVANGLVAADAAPYSGIQPLPLQLRFVVPSGSIYPVVPAAPVAGAGEAADSPAQPTTVDGDVSGHELTVDIAGVLVKSTSQVRGLYRV